ncbi:MAG: CoA transferase [Chloroflexi bacterium]|nr:CoA transferase [Chloroflexota bacterium]
MTTPGADPRPGPLEGLRVVEIGDRGEVAGKLLADAGADVIRVEPPSGARSRHIGPFVADRPDPNHSLSFHARNTSKRSVTLDLGTDTGRDLWRRLVGWSEVVIDSSGPGVLDALGAGYTTFADHVGFVWCSITPFGLTGPWRDWAAADLVNLALGGAMMSTGYEDHDLPPIRPDGEHTIAIANEYAVSGILSALWLRDGDGEGAGGGQLLDVSIHEAASTTTEGSFPNWEYFGRIVQRQTGRHASPDGTPPWQFLCTDGEYILLMGGGVPREKRILDALIEWIAETRPDLAQRLRDPAVEEVLYRDPRSRPDLRRMVSETIGEFVQSRPSQEIYRRGQSLHLPWGHVRRPEENLDDPHWADRGFFWEGEAPGHPTPVRYMGAPYRMTASPVRLRRRPPLLGEHNHEVYVGLLGVEAGSLAGLTKAGAI